MNVTAMSLFIALFLCIALSLNCIYENKRKLAGFLNIVSLCLTLALSYTFDQIGDIMKVLSILLLIICIIVGVKFYLSRKNKK